MKTKIEFRKQNIPFTQVSNEVLKDTKLSFKAKGLYAYIYSKPEDWQFSFRRIVKETSDGERSVLSAIDELEGAGLLRRLKQPDGRTVYWVTYPPSQFNDEKPSSENSDLGEKPSSENANQPKSLLAETATISNKELNTNKEEIQSNKDSATESQGLVKTKKKRVAKPIIWNEYLKKMDTNPQEHIQLISYYFRKRGVIFDTDFEVEEAISRHSRAATKVIKFGKNKVFKAVDSCQFMEKNRGIEWTLETVYKQLTK